MVEEDKIFESSMKFTGVFTFKDFYEFCYDWLTEETGLDIQEDKYGEKLVKAGTEKEINVEWTGTKKLTDYFQFMMKVKFEIKMLKDVEIMRDGIKEKTNDGEIKVSVKGFLVKDYDSKFAKTGAMQFLRSVYEKWVISSRVEQFENKVFGDSDEFLAQAKAWLALEGKR